MKSVFSITSSLHKHHYRVLNNRGRQENRLPKPTFKTHLEPDRTERALLPNRQQPTFHIMHVSNAKPGRTMVVTLWVFRWRKVNLLQCPIHVECQFRRVFGLFVRSGRWHFIWGGNGGFGLQSQGFRYRSSGTQILKLLKFVLTLYNYRNQFLWM